MCEIVELASQTSTAICFLKEIDYIVPTGNNFVVDTPNIDNEIKNIPGPQLVVPIDNARYTLNGID